MNSLRALVAAVLARVGMVLAVPALASAMWTYFAYELMIAPMGWGLTGRFIALVGAVAAGSLYWAGGFLLMSLVPRFKWWGRLLALPGILAYMALVIASSSYPQVTLFQGGAVEAEVADHVVVTSGYVDAVKLAVGKAKGLGVVAINGADTVRRLSGLERQGVFSGIASDGLVTATVAAMGEDVRQAGTGLERASQSADELITRIDAALAAMRAAADDRTLEFNARRRAFEAHSDEMRTLAIGLSQAMPLEAVGAVAARLQQKLVKPAFGGKEDRRRRQAEALEKLEVGLAEIGRDLAARVEVIAAGVRSLPPVYRPASAGTVVVTYWHTLVQAWAVSLAIDLFVIVLLWLACVAEDEVRRQAASPDTRPAWAAELDHSLAVVLELAAQIDARRRLAGPEPHPSAAAGRERGAREAAGNRRANGKAQPDTGEVS